MSWEQNFHSCTENLQSSSHRYWNDECNFQVIISQYPHQAGCHRRKAILGSLRKTIGVAVYSPTPNKIPALILNPISLRYALLLRRRSPSKRPHSLQIMRKATTLPNILLSYENTHSDSQFLPFRSSYAIQLIGRDSTPDVAAALNAPSLLVIDALAYPLMTMRKATFRVLFRPVLITFTEDYIYIYIYFSEWRRDEWLVGLQQ